MAENSDTTDASRPREGDEADVCAAAVNGAGHAVKPEADSGEPNEEKPSPSEAPSDASSKPHTHRRRNKPSLSCETCTVSKIFIYLSLHTADTCIICQTVTLFLAYALQKAYD